MIADTRSRGRNSHHHTIRVSTRGRTTLRSCCFGSEARPLPKRTTRQSDVGKKGNLPPQTTRIHEPLLPKPRREKEYRCLVFDCFPSFTVSGYIGGDSRNLIMIALRRLTTFFLFVDYIYPSPPRLQPPLCSSHYTLSYPAFDTKWRHSAVIHSHLLTAKPRVTTLLRCTASLNARKNMYIYIYTHMVHRKKTRGRDNARRHAADCAAKA